MAVRPVPFAVFFLFGTVSLFSLGSREPVVSDSAADALRDTRETYRIVVAGVVATDIGGELRPAVGSLPGLLLDLLQGYDRRFIPPAEQDAMRERIIKDALRTVERDLARQQEQRDRAALSSRTDEALQERIAALGEDRAALRNADRDRIAVASVKPVVYPEHDFRTFTELRYPQRLPGMFDADMVLYLTVEPVEPYLLVHIFATDRAGGEVHEVSRFVALPDELATALETVSDEVRTYVIGSSFASVSVRVTDPSGAGVPDAEIFIDAKLAGRGDAYQTTLTPGEHAILVRSGRGAIRRTSIMVEPGGFRIVVVRMPAAAGGTIRIESEPGGAEVYHGVEWAGSTPLEIPRPDTVVQYALRSDGYLESRFVAGPDTPGMVTRTLVGDAYDWEADFTRNRNRFYRSLGFFLGSLAGPVILNGLYQDLSGLFPTGSVRDDLTEEEKFAYADHANTIYYGYYSSLALSGAFFGNMIWRLTQYIRVGQGYHER